MVQEDLFSRARQSALRLHPDKGGSNAAMLLWLRNGESGDGSSCLQNQVYITLTLYTNILMFHTLSQFR